MRILVVDDQVLFRECLVALLRTQSDLQVIGEAHSCEQAVEIARRRKPDLILLDISLSDGSGLDIIKLIHSENPEAKIVILTGYENDEFLIRAIHNGAHGYLLKDMDISNVLKALRAFDRGEFALPQKMTQRVITEFIRLRTPLEGELDISGLTRRESDVLRLLCKKASNREIAGQLFISENTVRIHVHSILTKLNLQNRREVREKCSFLLGSESPTEGSSPASLSGGNR